MIYYSDDTLTIRTLTEADAHAIAAGEQAQGYDTTPDRFLSRLREQEEEGPVVIAVSHFVSQEMVAEAGSLGAAGRYLRSMP